MLLIWLAIGMYEIVSFILGALALLALGIVVLTNKETILKYLIVQDLPPDLVNKAGIIYIVLSVICFILAGEKKAET